MTQSTAVKTVTRQGNSLVVMISKEAKQMGLREGDKVEVSLSRTDLPAENKFNGVQAFRLLMDGHMLKSIDSPFAAIEDGTIYAMLDPLSACPDDQPKTSADIWLCFGEPIEGKPRMTWTARCNDAMTLVTAMNWAVQPIEEAHEITLNTRAYLAIIQDAKEALVKKDMDITEESVDQMILHLNDIGWDYDAKTDKGVYDAQRL